MRDSGSFAAIRTILRLSIEGQAYKSSLAEVPRIHEVFCELSEDGVDEFLLKDLSLSLSLTHTPDRPA